MFRPQEIDMSVGWVTDHILADVIDNTDRRIADAAPVKQLLEIQVDDYRAPNEAWDADQWEARQGFIYAPVSRSNWRIAFALARRLTKNGSAKIYDQDNKVINIELPSLIFIGGA